MPPTAGGRTKDHEMRDAFRVRSRRGPPTEHAQAASVNDLFEGLSRKHLFAARQHDRLHAR